MIRRPPRSTPLYSSAASDVYKRQALASATHGLASFPPPATPLPTWIPYQREPEDRSSPFMWLSLIHISEPTRLRRISYAVFCLKKKKKKKIQKYVTFFFLMIRRPPRSTPLYSSAASDVYKRQPGSHTSESRKTDHRPLC